MTEVHVKDIPWLREDFNLMVLLERDDAGQYRHALVDSLRDLGRRLSQRRQIARDRNDAARLAALIEACRSAERVIEAAHDAARDSAGR
jgi:hypothetical protein